MKTIEDTLREAVIKSGIPHLRIERESGVNRLSIGRFVRGMTSISLAQANELAIYFALKLTPATPTKRPRKD